MTACNNLAFIAGIGRQGIGRCFVRVVSTIMSAKEWLSWSIIAL